MTGGMLAAYRLELGLILGIRYQAVGLGPQIRSGRVGVIARKQQQRKKKYQIVERIAKKQQTLGRIEKESKQQHNMHKLVGKHAYLVTYLLVAITFQYVGTGHLHGVSVIYYPDHHETVRSLRVLVKQPTARGRTYFRRSCYMLQITSHSLQTHLHVLVACSGARFCRHAYEYFMAVAATPVFSNRTTREQVTITLTSTATELVLNLRRCPSNFEKMRQLLLQLAFPWLS